MHSFARACAQGRLDRCTCDESKSSTESKEAWLAGGCGDNIQYGVKFTQKFMSWMTESQDLKSTVDHHNTIVGTKVMMILSIFYLLAIKNKK